MAKLSIIVPIYNVEKYIAKCVKSLFEQTIDDIEYIFVNDGTPDNSMMILNEIIRNDYPHKKEQIKIIDQGINRGIANTRNKGLKAATSDYIIFCDSDDWVLPNMCEEMLDRAIEEDADIVVADLFLVRANKTKYWKQPFSLNLDDWVRNNLNGTLFSGNGNKLIRRDLFTKNSLKYAENINMWEDFLITIKLFHYAKNVSYINKAYYHYIRFNENSLTHKVTNKSLHAMAKAMMDLESFLSHANTLEKYKEDLIYAKLALKTFLLKHRNKTTLRRYSTLFPETNEYIFSCPNISFARKLRLYFASRNLLLLFRLTDASSISMRYCRDTIRMMNKRNLANATSMQ